MTKDDACPASSAVNMIIADHVTYTVNDMLSCDSTLFKSSSHLKFAARSYNS